MATTPEASSPPIWTALRRCGFSCALAQLPHLGNRHARLQALRLALCPVDFWRYAEFSAVLDAYQGERTVLDLGSPRLLARFLAKTHDARVTACDIAPSIADEVRLYRRGGAENMHGVRCDGARLPIAGGVIPFAYSVSVLEHIVDDGDRAALGEMARVLSPGGRLAITVPIACRHDDIWLDGDPFGAQGRRADGKVFFSRLYDWASARERLTATPGLRLLEARAWRVRDAQAFARYQRVTARPRSVASIWAKLGDRRLADTLLEECVAFESEITSRGILMLLLASNEQPVVDK